MKLNAKVWDDFTGGLRTNGNPKKLARNESPLQYSVEVTPLGSVRSSKGTTIVIDGSENHPGKKVTMLVNYKRSDGTKEVLVGYDGQVKQMVDFGTDAVTTTDLSTAITTDTSTLMYGTVIYDDTLYFSNGVDPFRGYDGTTVTAHTLTNFGGSTFNTNSMIIDDRKMFVIDYGDPTLLHRSKTDGGVPDDIVTFDYSAGSNVENSGTTRIKEGGEPLTGMAVLQEQLYVWQKNTINTAGFYTLGSDTLFKVSAYTKGAGAINGTSLVPVNDAVIFFDPQDGSITQLGQKVNFPSLSVFGISEAIRDKLQDEYDLSEAAAIYWKRKYLLACKSSSTRSGNDLVLILDLETGAIFLRKNWYVSTWMEYEGDLYFGSSIAPQVLKAFDGYADNDDDIIDWRHDTNIEDFGSPNLYKRMDSLFVEGVISEDEKIDVEIIFDYGRDSILKTIDGSNTSYIMDLGKKGYLGEDMLGLEVNGGAIVNEQRTFQVWIRTNSKSFLNMQVSLRKNQDAGIGHAEIVDFYPVGLSVDKELPPTNRIL